MGERYRDQLSASVREYLFERIESLRLILASIAMGSAVNQLQSTISFEMRRDLEGSGAGLASW